MKFNTFYKNFYKKKDKKRDSNDVTLLPLFCLTFEIIKLTNSVNYIINCPHVSFVDVRQI